MGTKKYEGRGRTIEEAREDALRGIDLEPWEDAKTTVLAEPSKGLLGMGARDAEVEVEIEVDKEEKAIRLLEEILDHIGIDGYVERDEDQEEGGRTVVLHIDVEGKDAARLIGKKAKTLNALQHLVAIMTNDGERSDLDLLLDVGSYRDKRRQQLEDMVRRVADKVLRTGKAISLDPMPRFERRWVHHFLSEMDGVESHSEGRDPERFLVIEPSE